MTNEGTRAKQVRKKQLAVLAMASGLVLVVAAGAAYFYSRTPIARAVSGKSEQETRPIVTGGAAFSEEKAWRQQTAAETTATKKELEDLKARIVALGDKKKTDDKTSSLAPPPPPPPRPASSGVDAGPPPPSLFAPPTSPLAASKKSPGAGASTFSAPPAPTPSPAEGAAPLRAGIGSIKFDDDTATKSTKAVQTLKSGGSSSLARKSDGNDEGGAGSGGSGSSKQAGLYIPAGTFARMVVLNGLDAPTGGQSQSNPSPVLLRVIDAASLPNGYKANLVGCVVTANGYGDISAERAYIRLDRMTCVNETGGAIDISVKGYVAGEDGKAGMRGRLVTKTGQILANALLAGLASGIGNALHNSWSSTTVGPFGGTTTTTPANAFYGGISGGAGTAFETISKYYLSLADKTFPVIEVDGARVADIVFSRGFTLETE